MTQQLISSSLESPTLLTLTHWAIHTVLSPRAGTLGRCGVSCLRLPVVGKLFLACCRLSCSVRSGPESCVLHRVVLPAAGLKPSCKMLVMDQCNHQILTVACFECCLRKLLRLQCGTALTDVNFHVTKFCCLKVLMSAACREEHYIHQQPALQQDHEFSMQGLQHDTATAVSDTISLR